MPEKASIEKLQKKEGRGIFLTALLAIYGIYLIFLTFIIFIPTPSEPNPIPYAQSMIIIIIQALLFLIIFIGICMWKKIAVYTFFIYSILRISIYPILLPLFFPKIYQWYESYSHSHSLTYYLWIQALYLLPWLWAIKRKWHLFS